MKKTLKKIAKFFLSLALVTVLQLSTLTIVHIQTAMADNTGTTASDPTSSTTSDCQTATGVLSPLCSLNEVGKDTNLPSYTGAEVHPDAVHTIEDGIAPINSAIFFALDGFKLAITSISIIVVIIAAIRLVANSTDEEAAKAKRALLFGVIGFLVIQSADPIVRNMFLGEEGDAFDQGLVEDSAANTVSYLRGVIGFVQLLLGAGAVMVIVMRGFTLLISSGEEEKVTNAKKHVIYAIIGLAIVGLSEVVVMGVVFPEAGSTLPDTNLAKVLLAKITNYVASFVAILAFISLFYAGYKYVVSGGNEEVNEKVKKSVLGSVIALLLAAGAFGLVNTVVTLDNTDASPSSSAESTVP